MKQKAGRAFSPLIAVLILLCFASAALAVPVLIQPSTAAAPTTNTMYTKPMIDPLSQPKFVNPLVHALMPAMVYQPDTTTFPGFEYYRISVMKVPHSVGLKDTGAANADLPVDLYTYGDDREGVDPVTGLPNKTGAPSAFHSYPGPTFELKSTLPANTLNPGKPVKVTWLNKLPATGPYLFPLDTTMMCGPNAPWCKPYNRLVAHVHGSHSYDYSDGLPEQWIAPNFSAVGTQFWTPPTEPQGTFTYPLTQEGGSTTWYHDHATGITRLNVLAGLAGFFLIRDDNEIALQNNNILPKYPYEIPIAIQDRDFVYDTVTGKAAVAVPDVQKVVNPGVVDPATGLACAPGSASAVCFVTSDPNNPGQPIPSIVPEYFGGMMLANGDLWPYHNVEPRKYRLRLLNGCDSRTLFIQFENRGTTPGVAGTVLPFMVIGSDDALLPNPVSVTRLDIMPGERYDVILDLTGIIPATVSPVNVVMTNIGPDGPYSPGAVPAIPVANPVTTGRIMSFRVTTPLGATPNATVTTATALRPAIAPLTLTNPTPRTIYLKETTDMYGRLQIKINNLGYFDPISELPALNAVEEWDIVNLTPDVHPIHLHLVNFQVVNREEITQPAVQTVPPTWTLTGITTTHPVKPEEAGWKDTIQMFPNTLTRVKAKFDLPGIYVWHCHILHHEEFDMMRQFAVLTPAAAVTLTAPATAVAGTAVKLSAQGQTGLAAGLPPTSMAYEYQFTVKAPGATTYTLLRAYSTDANLVWTPVAGTAGTYVICANIRQIGSAVAREQFVTKNINVTLPAVTAVTVTPSLASPQLQGNNIVFTAAAAGGTGTYQYRFLVKTGTTWTEVQPYSATATYTWNTAGLGGTYVIGVHARSTGNTAYAEAVATTSYSITTQPTTGGTLTASVPSPQARGTSVTFTATGTGGGATKEYRFLLKTGATWTVVQPYGAANTWTWNTAVAAGTYNVGVHIRTKGSAAYSEFTVTMPYTITVAAATGATITPAVASPQLVNTPISFTAAGAGGTGTYEYRFLVKTGTTWAIAQPYGTANTFTWTPAAAGTYAVGVHVRSVGSAAYSEATAVVPYKIN